MTDIAHRDQAWFVSDTLAAVSRGAALPVKGVHLHSRGVLAAVEIDAIASAVAVAVLGLDQEELSHHAGRTRYGYVEPTAAAWSLLEATLEPWLDDITRRAELGFHGPARQIALGMLQGLEHADDHGGSDELLLSWAPDFTDEARETVRRQLTALGIEPIESEGDCGSSATGP